MSHLNRASERASELRFPRARCLRTRSRRPNPHKSVALAGQERPFLSRFSVPRARLNERARARGRWEARRPFVRPRRMESRLA